MLGLEGTLSISLLLLMITQCMFMFIYRIVSLSHLKSSNKFWVETEKQLDKNIKLLQLDQDGEYISGVFNKYL